MGTDASARAHYGPEARPRGECASSYPRWAGDNRRTCIEPARRSGPGGTGGETTRRSRPGAARVGRGQRQRHLSIGQGGSPPDCSRSAAFIARCSRPPFSPGGCNRNAVASADHRLANAHRYRRGSPAFPAATGARRSRLPRASRQARPGDGAETAPSGFQGASGRPRQPPTAARRTLSVLEERFLELCESAAIPLPEVNAKVGIADLGLRRRPVHLGPGRAAPERSCQRSATTAQTVSSARAADGPRGQCPAAQQPYCGSTSTDTATSRRARALTASATARGRPRRTRGAART
jgi:hypothetical protein